MINNKNMILKERLKEDILTILKNVEINAQNFITKETFFLYTINEDLNYMLLNFVLEVVIKERFNIENDEGPELSLDFKYPEINDLMWDKSELIIQADYGRPKPLWKNMEQLTYKINDIDEIIYSQIICKIKIFVNEFTDFIISEINNNY